MSQIHNGDGAGDGKMERRAPCLRGFTQIASILSAREGKTISAESVRRSCRAAERKFARALADHVRPSWRSTPGKATAA